MSTQWNFKHFGLLAALPLLWGFSWPFGGPPAAKDLKLRLDEEGRVEINLSTREGEPAQFEIVTKPTQGRLEGQPPQLTYIPQANFFGQDQFTYRTVEGEKRGEPAQVTLFVSGVNDLPVAQEQLVSVDRNQPTLVSLFAEDVERDALVFYVVRGTNHGRLSGTPPFLEYHPAPDFVGEDSLVFVAEDPGGKGTEAKVTLLVRPPNQLPQARSTLIEVPKDQKRVFELPASDPEGQPLKAEILEAPQFGTLTPQADGLWAYQPKAGYEGKDRFRYRVFDGRDASLEAMISFEVLGNPQKLRLMGQLGRLIDQGGVMVGNSRHPDLVFGTGSYTPASVIKLATAAAALEILGPEHRFKTEVYLDGNRNLVVKGYGDPGWETADWYALARHLKERGVFNRPIRQLWMDLEAYEIRPDFDGRARGIEPFYAPIGPLVTNENLATVRISHGGGVASTDAKTPLTDSVRRKTQGLPRGIQQFNLAQTPKEGARYSLELAAEILAQAGMATEKPARFGSVPAGAQPYLVYKGTKTVSQLVERMLHRSSNYIANQLVMALSLHVYGTPAKLDRGVYLLEDFLERKVGLEAESFALSEGSGLSRSNRVSLSAMLKLVNYFERYAHLLPTAAQSHHPELAVGGSRVRLKSGTLSGVSNLIGYIETPSGEVKPFVIFLKDKRELRGKLLALLMDAYGGA
ncbi:MAG: D-alanyl-D-alanine carboxypeptidase [bacterium]|nr:D-alanyl-D-alanine carboxypeptidase [bacterium]